MFSTITPVRDTQISCGVCPKQHAGYTTNTSAEPEGASAVA